MPFKYARATQFLRGINLNTDTHPEAGYPQFDPNDVPGTLRFQIPDHSAAMQAPDNPGSTSGASSPPDYIGGVPPVGPKTTKMPLVDFISGFMDVLYHGALQVGTPAQNLTFQADTGSADLWTPYNCRYCANQDYNARRSSTFKLTPARCHLTYVCFCPCFYLCSPGCAECVALTYVLTIPRGTGNRASAARGASSRRTRSRWAA